MKKNFLLFILVILGSIIFAQEIQWIVTEDTQLNLYNNNGLKEIKSGTEICPQKHTSYEYQTDSITYINFNGAIGDINSNVVIPKNSHELFNDKLINFYAAILPYYNFDILQKKNRTVLKSMFNDTFESLKGEWYTEQECYESVIKYSSSKQLSLKNAIVTLSANNEQHCWLFVNTIEKIFKGYRCTGYIEYGWEDHIFITTPTKGPHTLLILFNGDFINVYEDSEDKLIMTYAITDEKTLNEFNNLILTGKCDLSNVTWPRHADGTSPYDNQNKPAKFDFESLYANSKTTTVSTPTQPCTNVSVNKTMSVTENLKLRSGEATTTSVLTVMSAGTKIKILELGKEETIDGINSNWVKVEVISGKDRDGNKLKSGMTGWCYGGYLE